ncbi:hypothetical protein BH10ACT11_BH10ACT11_11610 [soil metagenome]
MSDGSGWRDPFEDEERAREREERRAERNARRRDKGEGTRKSLADRVRNQLSGGAEEPTEEPGASDESAPPEPDADVTPPAAEPAPSPAATPPPADPSPPAPLPEPPPEPAEPAAPDPGETEAWEMPDPSSGYPEAGDPKTADHPQADPDGFWDGEAVDEPRHTTDSHSVVPPPPVGPHPDAPSPEDWPDARSREPRRKRSTIWRRRIAGLFALLALIAIVGAAAYAISKRGNDAPVATAPVKPRKTESVTIPEGYTRVQMADVAKKAKLKGDYMKASEKSKKIDLAKLGAKKAKNLEGVLFPATYELFKNASAQDLVDKQVEAFQQNFDGIDMKYAKSKNLTPYDITIIASMIEREIQKPSERKLAASVIYNRLKDGTPLGIDATIRYEDNNFTEPLLESRLEDDTPYNTRINTGLPPGPIGNPGLASLEAAANPAKTDYFFYVVKPGTCGQHVFVKTQAEFDQATADYNNARNAAGGKSPTTC